MGDFNLASEQGLTLLGDSHQLSELVWTRFPSTIRQIFLSTPRRTYGYVRSIGCWYGQSQDRLHVLRNYARSWCGRGGGKSIRPGWLQVQSNAQMIVRMSSRLLRLRTLYVAMS